MSESSNQRLGFAIIVAAATVVLIWGIRGLANILNPILLAAVITITLLPVPKALEKRGLKSGRALLMTILLVVLFIVGFTWLMLASISQMNEQLATYSASFQAQNDSTEQDATAVEEMGELVMSTLTRQQYSQLFSTFLAVFGNAISQLFLTLLIFIFMLYTALSLPNLSRIGIDAGAGVLDQVIGLTSYVRRYMVLTAFINLLVGIGDALLLWLFDVPYAILWGGIAWVLGFIPAVGYWLALIPPVLLAYGLYGTRTALIIFIMYAVINGTAANIISPRVLGKGLSISPLIVFVSVFIWGWLLGAIGAILAIPLTMLIIAILGSFPTTRWVARLMSYVPGSEKEADVEAVGYAKGLLARMRQRIPSLKTQEPVSTMEDIEASLPEVGLDGENDHR
jgi:predicted PurR-regulated permease PerM